MSATQATALNGHRSTYRAAPHKLSFGGILRSEWIKLTSVRSIGWSIAIAVVLTAGVGILGVTMILASEAADPSLATEPAPLTFATTGIMISQLVFAVLGVIAITGEYSSGQIRSSLTAVPTRLPVLGAKALVLGVIAFVASAVSISSAMLGASMVAGAFDVTLATEDYGREFIFTTLGGSVYLSLLTVFSLGVGTIMRSAAGAISVVLGLMLVAPTVFALVPVQWLQETAQYLISNAGFVVSTPSTEPSEAFWRSLATLCVWSTTALVGAAFSLARRDA